MTNIGTTDWLVEVQKGNIPGHSIVHKFGRNPDIDGPFEAIWNGGDDYTGFNAKSVETVEIFSSSANDAGTVLSSGTATGGSATTLIDTGATFSSDGVAVDDVVINDTQLEHGIVTAVSETTLTVLRMGGAIVNASGDSYRIVTAASTGMPVIKLRKLLDGNRDSFDEYIVLNGLTGVDTVGTYLRCSRGKCIGNSAVGSNVGAITARQKVTTANIFVVLPIGYNQTMIACDTIPNGFKGYLLGWYAALAKKQVAFSNVRLITSEVNDAFQVKEEFTISSSGSSYVRRAFEAPKDGSDFCPMSDIKIMADSSVGDNAIAAGFDLLLVAE